MFGQILANDPNIYEKLVASLAPSVWEMEDVKKGLLCQLFGGSESVKSKFCIFFFILFSTLDQI